MAFINPCLRISCLSRINHGIRFSSCHRLIRIEFSTLRYKISFIYGNLDILRICNRLRLRKCIFFLLKLVSHAHIHCVRHKFPCCRIIRPEIISCLHIDKSEFCRKHHCVIILIVRTDIRVIVIRIVLFLHRHIECTCQQL